jgi:branched-chain amino acid transport system permease protein
MPCYGAQEDAQWPLWNRYLGNPGFFLLRELLADYGTWYMILLGALAVLAMMRYPQGLWGLVSERWDLHLFPVQRRVRDS